ncbi:MAG: hypothetical protein JXR73_04190 [Candidatus Omnitrophica bacterium]|nr:hypothetical protein [Candidatus Omnitrophota bacterium]
MDNGIEGFVIDVAWEGSICPYCGQERNPDRSICDMCFKQMTTVVLAICKDLLYHTGRVKQFSSPKNQEKDSGEAVQEMAVYKVLDQFPFDFAKRTSQFKKSLETEGVWFSHLTAYRFIRHLRSDPNVAPPMILCDPMYEIVRQQVYEFLQNPDPDEDACEAFQNVYNIPESSRDARAVINNMIEELERMKRLKIARSQTNCRVCGKELTTGKAICRECEREEMIKNRMTISSSGTPQPLLPSESEEEERSNRGMHWR